MEVSGTFRTIAMALAVVLLIGWIAYYWFNIRSARDEVGSEIELAPNTSAPIPDTQLEGNRLERWQFIGVVMLLIIGLGLPIYWLREPGRQAAADVALDEWSVAEGAELYQNGFQCANCHGADGGGGVAGFIFPVPLTDDAGEFIIDDEGAISTFNIQVRWVAPSVNDALLRYSEEEVAEILVYGRPGSPMAAWGVEGGGVGTDQQIAQVIRFLDEITRLPEDVVAEHTAELEAARELSATPIDDGEWLFQQHCGRCHTQGWQWAQQFTVEELVEAATNVDAAAPGTELPIGSQGGGAFGPRLAEENLTEQWLTAEEQAEWIAVGADDNVGYGIRGIGNGQMPGFGQLLSEDQILAIVEYERSLTHDDDAPTAVGEACREYLAADAGPPELQPDEDEGVFESRLAQYDAQIDYCTSRLEGSSR